MCRSYRNEFGLAPVVMNLAGSTCPDDPLRFLASVRRKRNYALQESVNMGQPCVFQVTPGIVSWIVALEDRRMVHGGFLGGEVLVTPSPSARSEHASFLVSHGLARSAATEYLEQLPSWPEPRAKTAADFLHKTFYNVSGWQPELLNENRLKALQQEQINQAIEDQRRHGQPALYAFEKERLLLANIRAGDRNGARRLLNEMLATIYMSSPQLVVLRARTIELMSCLTRAAIEDNPLLEPLIESNHAWTERLVKAKNFEELSHVLTDALDDFIDGIYLHGMNRSNARVRKALDFISHHFAQKISLAQVAREAQLSPCRLAHLVKDLTGRSVVQIIHQVRVRHAQHLLEKTSMSAADIAYASGFGDQSYFIKHFRRLTGTTPARYRSTRHNPE